MEFLAYHGVLESEKTLGNYFVVDFEADWSSRCALSDSLSDTIDYSAVYEVIASVMAERMNLLETVADSICRRVAETFPSFRRISVCVGKKNPPLGGSCAFSKVSAEWIKE